MPNKLKVKGKKSSSHLEGGDGGAIMRLQCLWEPCSSWAALQAVMPLMSCSGFSARPLTHHRQKLHMLRNFLGFSGKLWFGLQCVGFVVCKLETGN